ncbi:hypothetical protein PYR67_17525 [Rhizobium sp. BC49]|uniref:hypothetical protein n=1 Tax=Rhizobium sp. BC49 TaxID=3031127 RepID=UPI0023D88489|nr:hypothetical protein [Rhizobium sp. BC49]MDF0661125.1 hypothetical protein [Rhizobium sp. BC49]
MRIEFGIAGSIVRLDTAHHHQFRRRLAGRAKAEPFLQSGTVLQSGDKACHHHCR